MENFTLKVFGVYFLDDELFALALFERVDLDFMTEYAVFYRVLTVPICDYAILVQICAHFSVMCLIVDVRVCSLFADCLENLVLSLLSTISEFVQISIVKTVGS